MKKSILILATFLFVISCSKKEVEVANDEPYVGKWEYIKYTTIGSNFNGTVTLASGSYLILNKDKSFEQKITGGTISLQVSGSTNNSNLPASQGTGTCDILSTTQVAFGGITYQITKLTSNELIYKTNQSSFEATYYYKK